MILAVADSLGAGVPVRELALVLLVACVVTYLTTGPVRTFVVRYGPLAAPRERDVHRVPTPRLGGVAMLLGCMAAVLTASQLPALNRGFPPVTPDMLAVVVAALVIAAVGVLDDLYDISWVLKLGGQVVGAVVMSLMGVSWYLLYLPVGGGTTLVLDELQSTVITAVITVAVINAMNFVDGLDGLAAGLGAIAGGTILVYSLTILHDQGGTVSAYPPAMISAVLVGVCVGFLPHNFAPARIFMGDSGSMLIGLLLSAACVSTSGRINMSLFGPADAFALLSPLFVVAAALFIPMLDLLLAVVRRVSAGKSPFAPDKQHLHHRLLRIGHGQRQVVLILYMWVAVVAFGAVGSTVLPPDLTAVAFGVAILLAVVVTGVPLHRARVARARTDRGGRGTGEGSPAGAGTRRPGGGDDSTAG